MSSWYAPSRNAARTRLSSSSTGRDDTCVRRWSTARRMRTVPYTSSVTRPRSRASNCRCRNISGTRMCANAPCSIRSRASNAVRRGVSTLMGCRQRGSPRRPARHTRPSITRLPSGCTSSSVSASRAVPSVASGAISPGARDVVGAVSSARSTFTRRPSTVNHAPGRGFPARTRRARSLAGRAGSIRNSSTSSLFAYVGSPRCGSGVAVGSVGR